MTSTILYKDHRSKPFRLGRIEHNSGPNQIGIKFDSWDKTYAEKLKTKTNEHLFEMQQASYAYKPGFFTSFSLCMVEYNIRTDNSNLLIARLPLKRAQLCYIKNRSSKKKSKMPEYLEVKLLDEIVTEEKLVRQKRRQDVCVDSSDYDSDQDESNYTN